MSVFCLLLDILVSQVNRSKRFSGTSSLANEWSDYCPVYAAVLNRIALVEIAEYCRLLPWGWVCVCVSGIHQWCLKKRGRNDKVPRYIERLKNCPFIVPVQQDVTSWICKFHWNCDFSNFPNSSCVMLLLLADCICHGNLQILQAWSVWHFCYH